VHYVDLGLAVDLDDPALSFDGLHLTAAGNARVADQLAPAVRRVMGS
jgi:lysophospholipase L1-like esterase